MASSSRVEPEEPDVLGAPAAGSEEEDFEYDPQAGEASAMKSASGAKDGKVMRQKKMKIDGGASRRMEIIKYGGMGAIVFLLLSVVLLLVIKSSHAAKKPTVAPPPLPSSEEVLAMNPWLSSHLQTSGELAGFVTAWKADPSATYGSLLNAGWTIALERTVAARPTERPHAADLPDGGASPDNAVVLLTTVYLSASKGGDGHTPEMLGALSANLLNKYIKEVHVLLQSPDAAACDTLLARMTEVVTTVAGKAKKLKCRTAEPSAATFARLLALASSEIKGPVLLATPDTVFDSSLELVDHTELATGKRALFLSTSSPPAEALYKSVLRMECLKNAKCVVGQFDNGRLGWRNTGKTFAAALLWSPLKAAGLETLSFNLDVPSGFRVLAKLLVDDGVVVSNPCMVLRAYEWHCRGPQARPHDLGPEFKKLLVIMPSDHGAGVRPPAAGLGSVAARQLCRSGTVTKLKSERLLSLFIYPQTISLCCDKSHGCDQDALFVKWQESRSNLPYCTSGSQTTCVVYNSSMVNGATVSARPAGGAKPKPGGAKPKPKAKVKKPKKDGKVPAPEDAAEDPAKDAPAPAPKDAAEAPAPEDAGKAPAADP